MLPFLIIHMKGKVPQGPDEGLAYENILVTDHVTYNPQNHSVLMNLSNDAKLDPNNPSNAREFNGLTYVSVIVAATGKELIHWEQE